LEAIALWIVAHVGSQVADRKLEEIAQTITGQVRMPHKGAVRDDIALGLRGILAARRAAPAFSRNVPITHIFSGLV